MQEVVKLTFSAFHDVLKAQSDAIKTLERALETKATKSELAAVSQAKASAADVDAQLSQIRGALKMKADRCGGLGRALGRRSAKRQHWLLAPSPQSQRRDRAAAVCLVMERDDAC